MINSPHRRARRLLPWLVNGTVAPRERRRLESHLGECARCRRERAAAAELAARIAALPTPEVRPHPARVAALVARLDEERGAGLRARLRGAFGRLVPAPAGVWLIVGAQAVAVALAAALLLVDRRAEPPVYRTLTVPAEPGHAMPRLRIVFTPDLTAASIAELLESVDGRIVDGPSPLGVYTVELASGDGELERAVETLRGEAGVLLAEPVP